MARFGRRNRPFFRIGVFDARTRRDGRAIEFIGTYDPLAKGGQKKVVMDRDRLQYWMSRGAQLSEKLEVLLKHCDIL
jgi:small subunit ribosomal protein S16